MFGAAFWAVCLAATAALCAVALGVWRYLAAKRARTAASAPDPARVFLFEGMDLVDASPRAEEILTLAQTGASDWSRMISVLSHQFPGLDDRLAEIDEKGTVGVRSTDGAEQLIATTVGSRIRVTVMGSDEDGHRIEVEPLVFRSMLRELETLRTAADGMPFPVWRQTDNGELIWANRAYRLAADAGEGVAKEVWPPPVLFPQETLADVTTDGAARRLQPVGRSGPDGTWFECRAVPTGSDVLYSAVAVDATVQAERQLRDFMQTLTKTFSHLATGLAIFDRRRRLAMFNPALTDLTGLPIDFLAARPTLYGVLDRLRDRRMIPEPRDYGSWRQQIAELEAAALDGTYSETWTLPDARTYRVTGRPHHGGAMALLIEDISAEMSLTRRFRSELELGQAVIDALDEAIAVFSPAGDLTMVNTAYQSLWKTDIADTAELPTVAELSRLWMARAASPVWGEIRDFVLHEAERGGWEDSIALSGGRALDCRVAPLAGGATLVSFQERQAIHPPRVMKG